MSLAPWILKVLLALPVAKADLSVDPEVKREQIEVIADAINVASFHSKWPGTRRELALMLIVVAKEESALALNVHAGNCRPYECDHGRARGLWQQQITSTSTPFAWHFVAGVDWESTVFAAREAARALVRARNLCRSLEQNGADWLGMTVSAYAGRGCKGYFPGRNERVTAFNRLGRYD